MKRVLGTLIAAVFTFGLLASANAQETITKSMEPERNMHLGLRIMMLPVGSVKNDAGSIDLGFAFGLSPYFDYNIVKYFAVGFGPEFYLNIKTKDSIPGVENEASKAINFNLRLKGMYPLMNDALNVYVVLTPGYSIVLPPGDGTKPKGLDLAFAGGASYNFTPMLGAFVEAGYSLGFHKMDEAKANMNFLQFNLGAQASF